MYLRLRSGRQIEEIVQVEEQIVNIPDPPIVEEIVDVVQIYSQEHFRQCTVEQVADSLVSQIVEEMSEVTRLRTTEQIAQELLLGSVAALDRSTSFCYSTWINVSPSVSVGFRKIVFMNRSRSRFRMLQPKTKKKKKHTKSELWTVCEMARPTSLSP